MIHDDERIVAAAIFQDGNVWSVPPPGRHHDVFAHMRKSGIENKPGATQGFVTSTGRFVTRTRAMLIATKAEQIIKKTGPSHLLFSEDVW